jgi:hypothetical protein
VGLLTGGQPGSSCRTEDRAPAGPPAGAAGVVVSFTAVTVGSRKGQPQGCCAMLLNSGRAAPMRDRKEPC